jgi:hypothetical protein
MMVGQLAIQKYFQMPRAVILTSHPDDYQILRSYLTEIREETHPQGTIH